jgi:adenosylcobinamide-phosphate synthase
VTTASGTLSLWLLVTLACGLDRLVGDPHNLLHPVQVMGAVIGALRNGAERWAGDRAVRLRLAGGLITVFVVGGSAAAGTCLEALARRWPLLGLPLLLIGLASALAGRSLEQAVRAVLTALEGSGSGRLEEARHRLAWIVGRDVEGLEENGILRALAETAAENGVDGLFGPLFWMLVGAVLGGMGGPGPLTLAWAYKASSTLDSMLGYRRGRLRWLGTAGARLDDLLTWLPCRLVALSLPPLAGANLVGSWRSFRRALKEGAPDPSPNAGVSQAAYALAAGVRLGGVNHYGGIRKAKPLLATDGANADRAGVERILALSRRLQLCWLTVSLMGSTALVLLGPALGKPQ